MPGEIPDPVRKRYHDALSKDASGSGQDAVRELTSLIEEFPQFDDAHEALSVILYNQKKYDEAISCLKNWIRANPEAIMARTNLSRCYVAKDMIAEAEHEQSEARRLTWKADLKAKKMEMPEVNYAEQIERYKQVIDLDPADVLGYFSLASTYMECGKKREALDTFEKAVEVDPGHSSSYLGLGSACEALGDRKKARRIYEKGIKVAEEKGDMMAQKKMEARIRGMNAAEK